MSRTYPAAKRGGASWAAEALDSLRTSREFRLLWFSNVCFFGGAWMQAMVLGWVAFAQTNSEVALAVFGAVRLAPMMLGPLSGVLADRFNRVRLLRTACWWALGACTVVSTEISLGRAPYWMLLVAGLAVGMAQSPSQPARGSLVLELVKPQQLNNAVAWNSVALNVTQVIGPAVGGLLVSTLGAPTAMWVATAYFAGSLALLRPLRGRGSATTTSHEPVLRMLTTGLLTIARNRRATAVLLVTLAANVLLWPVYQSFMPVFAHDQLGFGAGGLGALLCCSGVGAVVGAVIISGLGDFRYKGALFVGATTIWGLAWAAFASATNPVVAFSLMAVVGLSSAGFGVLQNTLLLIVTEAGLHGRVLGLQELAIGVMPLSTLVLGAVGSAVGVSRTTFVCGLVMAAVTLALVAWTPAMSRIGRGTAYAES